MGMDCYAIGGPFWRADHGSISWQEDVDKQIPGSWGEVDDAESIRALHAAMDMACSNRTIPIPGFEAMHFGQLNKQHMRQINEILGRRVHNVARFIKSPFGG